MSHHDLYEHIFSQLLLQFKRNVIGSERTNKDNEIEPVIDICGDAFRKYKEIVSRNQQNMLHMIKRMFISLMKADGRLLVNPSEMKTKSLRVFDIIEEHEGSLIAYCFEMRQKKGLKEIHKNIEASVADVKSICWVFLDKYDSRSIDMLNDIEKTDFESKIHFMTLKEFFVSEFGEDEYFDFSHAVEVFNSKSKRIIGLATSELPTGEALEKYREKKAKYLFEYDFESLLPKKYPEEHRKLLHENFIEKRRYEMLIYPSDRNRFADSFLSSEWYFDQIDEYSGLEQTAIVVGYLKSIEQLLYGMIRFWINSSKIIKINPKYTDKFDGLITEDGWIDFSEENESKIDATLGSEIRFIKKYKEVLFNQTQEGADKAFGILIDKLYGFKDSDRNDKLHQNNLYTEKEVKQIRKMTYELYYLIIGSLDITDDYVNGMCNKPEMVEDPIPQDKLKEVIYDWIMPILKYDVGDCDKALAFSLFEYPKYHWRMSLITMSRLDEKKKETFEWNYAQNFNSNFLANSLQWISNDDYDSMVSRIAKIMNELLETESSFDKFENIVIGSQKVDATVK